MGAVGEYVMCYAHWSQCSFFSIYGLFSGIISTVLFVITFRKQSLADARLLITIYRHVWESVAKLAFYRSGLSKV